MFGVAQNSFTDHTVPDDDNPLILNLDRRNFVKLNDRGVASCTGVLERCKEEGAYKERRFHIVEPNRMVGDVCQGIVKVSGNL